MNDKRFLTLLHDRLVNIHGEDANTDYMLKLKSIIDVIPSDQNTTNTCNRSIEEIKNREWIDYSSYYELLKRWRFSTSEDTIFQGEIGIYYAEVMNAKKRELKPGEDVSISKLIGWD